MQGSRRSLVRGLVVASALAAAALTTGCSDSLKPGDPGYKSGALGNGGFAFLCDDSVACSRWSGTAAKFPKTVSLGATFDVFYIPKDSNTVVITIDNKPPPDGTTIDGVGDTYLSRGQEGLVALKSGVATIAAKDSSGVLIDYTTVQVVAPDSLVVYDSADANGSTTPPKVTDVAMKVGDRRSFRALARSNNQDLAGALQYEWRSDGASVVDVESYSQGTVTVVARAPGKANLEVTGGSFTQALPVEVSQ